MSRIETVNIAHTSIPLSFILTLYENIPEDEKPTFIEKYIHPEDKDTVHEAINLMLKSKVLETIIAASKETTLVKYAKINCDNYEAAHRGLTSHACELLLTLADNDLHKAYEMLKTHLNRYENV